MRQVSASHVRRLLPASPDGRSPAAGPPTGASAARSADADPRRPHPARHAPACGARARAQPRAQPDDDERRLWPAPSGGLPVEPARRGFVRRLPVGAGDRRPSLARRSGRGDDRPDRRRAERPAREHPRRGHAGGRAASAAPRRRRLPGARPARAPRGGRRAVPAARAADEPRGGDDHERRAGRDRSRRARLPAHRARRCWSSRRPIRTRSTRSGPPRRVLVPLPLEAGWDDDLVGSSFRQSLPRLAYFTPDFNNPTGRLMRSVERAFARPRGPPRRHAAARRRELPRARARGRSSGRRAARRSRPRARDLGRRAEQERLGRPAHRLGAGGAVRSSSGSAPRGRAWTSPTRCSSSSSALQLLDDLDALSCRAPAPARTASSKRSLTRSRRSSPTGRSRCRTADSASGLRSTARARRSSARRRGRRADRSRAAIRHRRHARAIPAPPVRVPAGDAPRSGVPAGAGRRDVPRFAELAGEVSYVV